MPNKASGARAHSPESKTLLTDLTGPLSATPLMLSPAPVPTLALRAITILPAALARAPTPTSATTPAPTPSATLTSRAPLPTSAPRVTTTPLATPGRAPTALRHWPARTSSAASGSETTPRAALTAPPTTPTPSMPNTHVVVAETETLPSEPGATVVASVERRELLWPSYTPDTPVAMLGPSDERPIAGTVPRLTALWSAASSPPEASVTDVAHANADLNAYAASVAPPSSCTSCDAAGWQWQKFSASVK